MCTACHSATNDRIKRRRERRREDSSLRHILTAHEHAGDKAREHHLYENAAEHYQHALDIQTATRPDRTRIGEKLIYTLFLTNNPEKAATFYDELLVPLLDAPDQATRAVEILLQMARQMWQDSKTREALPVIRRAVLIAEAAGNTHLQRIANLKLANYLMLLERFDDAVAVVQGVDISDPADVIPATDYHKHSAGLASVFGKAREAYDHCERAVSLIRESGDPFQAFTVWNDYAISAEMFGDIELEKTCLERRLLIARRNHLGWCIPEACIDYADVFAKNGEI